MAIRPVSCGDFDSVIAGNSLVIVLFWTSWCKPCRAFAPAFESSAQLHPEVVHATVDTDAEQDLISKLRIFAIPTLLAFHGGAVVYNEPGVLSAPQLDGLITKLNGLELPEAPATVAACAVAASA